MKALLQDTTKNHTLMDNLENCLVNGSSVAEVCDKWSLHIRSHNFDKASESVFVWYQLVHWLNAKFSINQTAAIDAIQSTTGLKVKRQRYLDVEKFAVLNRCGFTGSFWSARNVFKSIHEIQSKKRLESFEMAAMCWLKAKQETLVFPTIRLSSFAPSLAAYDNLLAVSDNTKTGLVVRLPDREIDTNNKAMLAIAWVSMFFATTELHMCNDTCEVTGLLSRLAEEHDCYITMARRSQEIEQEVLSNASTNAVMEHLVTLIAHSLSSVSGIDLDPSKVMVAPLYANQLIKGFPELIAELCMRRWLV
ncbi:hypothetical protein L1D14_10410 [Vibrio tubiashii]|uniref:hypothetical protein n=1 Tax=Vibrio tubiashii TaxID=29498 RepID=UPI001EFC459C|nr:hypothetical protein [Vibrio tubiashii]MCG9576649.1 hypothetical protein [Vibrio tubiashii]